MTATATLLRLAQLPPARTQAVHAYNPVIPPAEPSPAMTKYQMGASPVAWPTQCRVCWGWVDDPRHFTPVPDGDGTTARVAG